MLDRSILLRASALLLLAAVAQPPTARAGAYMFAGSANGVGIVTHPNGYTGAGGTLTVTVCIDPAAADAADMVIPTENVVRTFNARQVSSQNLVTGAGNDVPPTAFDWESLLLHEMGHCVGAAHPHLGSESGLGSPSSEYVRSTSGGDAAFDLDDGADNVIGTPDDQRDDDVNLSWFRKNSNHPFAALPAAIDSNNWSRNLADLPAGHSYASGASSEVATTLGLPNLEAVMHQVQTNDEAQRELTADDWAVLRYAESGLDETANSSDDYTLQLDYVGMGTACDIVITSVTTGFGQCTIGGTFLNATHVAITTASLRYNENFEWYFNPVSNEGNFLPAVPGLSGRPLAFGAFALALLGAAVLRQASRPAQGRPTSG